LKDHTVFALAGCVTPDSTIRHTMQQIETSGMAIAFVVEASDRKLIGTVSDGDIRRALLAGAQLDDPILPYANKHFISVSPAEIRSHALDLMRALGLSQIPIVDQEKRILGVHLLREILGSIERPNWAVIMAGGRGERLRPLTDHIPKPMIKVAGRPLLERLILHYVGYGVRTVFLAVNYMSETIKAYFENGERFGCHIRYLEETRPLGTAGALSLLPEIPVAPILIANGDLITDFDVGAMLATHTGSRHVITIGVREYRHTVPFGVLEMEQGFVRSVREKPSIACLTNAGVYVLEPHLLQRIPKETEFTMPELIAECLLRDEAVGGYSIDGDWLDIGRPVDLQVALGASAKD